MKVEPASLPLRIAAAVRLRYFGPMTTRSLFLLLLCAATPAVRADQVSMQNGDRYNGKVLSVSSNSVLFQSEVLGNLTLPRAKVASIDLGNGPVTRSQPTVQAATTLPRVPSATRTNVEADFSAAFRQMGSQTNLIQQIQSQFLAGAGQEANDKFEQMMGDLINGKMSVNDLAAQAKGAADQLRAFRKELGEDAGGGELDAYLSILDSFLNQVPATPSGLTNASSALVKTNLATSQQK